MGYLCMCYGRKKYGKNFAAFQKKITKNECAIAI
jgi:hypothetical protein